MKRIILLAVILSLLLLCGCTGYREIDRGYIVTAIGVSQKEGKINLFVEAISSSDVVDKPSERAVLHSTGDNINTAFKSLKESLVKPLYFEQTGTVIVEKSVSDDGKKELFALCKKHSAIGLGVYIVSTDELNSLFEINSPNGILGYDVIGLIDNYEKSTNKKLFNRLFEIKRQDFLANNLPVVSVIDNRLKLKAVDG